VAQTYIDNPLLIDTLKFDLRLYVLLFGIQPLRIYLFDDGLARFATTPYQSALRGDKKNLFIHLTNYAINKKNENYVQNENFDGGTGTTLDGSRAKRDNSPLTTEGGPEE
jgi:tubulin polyglutamylase TTLL6/13